MTPGTPQLASPAFCHTALAPGVLRLVALSGEMMYGDPWCPVLQPWGARSTRGRQALGRSPLWSSTGPLKESEFFVKKKKKIISKYFARRGTQKQSGLKSVILGSRIFHI